MENKKEVLNDLHRKKAAICFGCGVRVYMREKKKKKKERTCSTFSCDSIHQKDEEKSRKKRGGG